VANRKTLPRQGNPVTRPGAKIGFTEQQLHYRKLPQTPRARKVIEYSMEEARSLNHNYIGTEHILLGLLREREGIAAIALRNCGLNLDDARAKIAMLMRQIHEEFREGRSPPNVNRSFFGVLGRSIGRLFSR